MTDRHSNRLSNAGIPLNKSNAAMLHMICGLGDTELAT